MKTFIAEESDNGARKRLVRDFNIALVEGNVIYLFSSQRKGARAKSKSYALK